jgi:hypothetical protein
LGSLVKVRLYQKIKDSLKLEIGEVRFFSDSSAVIGMIFKDSGTFLEFVGTRVSEIRTKSKVDTEWFWISGELNPADMGTRISDDDALRHGNWHALPKRYALDVSAGIQLASQKRLHSPAARRMPKGRDSDHVCCYAESEIGSGLSCEGNH